MKISNVFSHTAAFFALTVVVMICSCDKYSLPEEVYGHNRFVIQFVNMSEDSVSFFVPEAGKELPDTLNSYYSRSFYVVDGCSSMLMDCMFDGRQDPIETYGKGARVPFYVFDTKALRERGWKEIVGAGAWLGKYEYTAEEILRMNKRVTYPNTGGDISIP